MHEWPLPGCNMFTMLLLSVLLRETLCHKFCVCKQESVQCRVCSANTHKLEYVTYLYDVTALEVAAEERRQPHRRLGQLLHAIATASHRFCDKDEGTSPFFC